MHIQLRKATIEDGELLLLWRNDPRVHRYYFAAELVERETHFRWLVSSLKSDTRDIYIAEVEGIPVGMIRLDRAENGRTELSWAVDPAWQGKGIGKALLKEARRISADVLFAEINVKNIASIKIAETSGFTLEKEENGILLYVFEP